MDEHGGSAVEPSVPLSALEHWAYCPRQAGLILLEDGYAENADTVRGSLAHERVDQGDVRYETTHRIVRAIPVFSDRLGLHGVADVVEIEGTRVTPVEFKVGRYRPRGPADLQVAGQAMCLEEMFRTTVPTAIVFSVAERRRHSVELDPSLRAAVLSTAAAIREALRGLSLPPAVDDSRCHGCSMNELCIPHLTASRRRVSAAEAALFLVKDD